MNIYITDRELVKNLMNATLAKVVVGSRMYKTHNEDINIGPISDTDYLYIYATSENELLSVIKTHHQYQFKEDGIDYNFVSLHTFIHNILNGDSPINFEVLQSFSLINTPLEWLHRHNNSFITYTIVRSMLGICRRDIKHYHKETTEYKKKKRLGHIIRGYLYAKSMIDHNFNMDECHTILKNEILDVSTNLLLRKYEKHVSELRLLLNEKFEKHTLNLPQHINVEKGVEFTKEFLEFCKTDKFKEKQEFLKDFDMSEFINSYENWVTY